MDKYIYDENNGLWYELQGEYYLPCLSLPPEEEKPTFDATYATPEHAARPVAYASRQELFLGISKRYSSSDRPVQAQQASATQRRTPRSAMGLYSEDTRP